MNGVLVIDKPKGLTSHDVVNRVRRILGQKAVGHLGTLDPAATGLLPMVLGNLTRIAQFYLHSEKCYEGVIRFGFATDTFDADGEPSGPIREVRLSPALLEETATHFRGPINQLPPPFSAKKVGGVPAYKLARKKQEVVLQPVNVEIKELEFVEIGENTASFRARVTSGTYMRSVAHDIGQRIGCGGHLTALRRTTLAEFHLDDAHTLRELESAAQKGSARELLVHPRRLLPQFPPVTANEEVVALIRHGRAVNLPELSKSRLVKVFQGQECLVAIATRVAGTLFHAGIVFGETVLAS